MQVLAFDAGELVCGIEISRVGEVLDPVPWTRVPGAPRPAPGVIAIGGTVLTYVDVAARLGVVSRGRRGALLVVDGPGEVGACALRVDALRGLEAFADGAVVPPEGVLAAAADVLDGIVLREGEALLVIDLDRLLDPRAVWRAAAGREIEGGKTTAAEPTATATRSEIATGNPDANPDPTASQSATPNALPISSAFPTPGATANATPNATAPATATPTADETPTANATATSTAPAPALTSSPTPTRARAPSPNATSTVALSPTQFRSSTTRPGATAPSLRHRAASVALRAQAASSARSTPPAPTPRPASTLFSPPSSLPTSPPLAATPPPAPTSRRAGALPPDPAEASPHRPSMRAAALLAAAAAVALLTFRASRRPSPTPTAPGTPQPLVASVARSVPAPEPPPIAPPPPARATAAIAEPPGAPEAAAPPSSTSTSMSTTTPADIAPATPPSAHAAEPALAALAAVRVVRGDTLWHLAAAHLGDARAWPALFDANRGVLVDPDLITPGQELALPRRRR